MDPQNPASFNHRTEVISNGRTYHFVDQLPENYDPGRHPTLLCVHGFPDSWYGWRYQIGPWVRRGCRVVAPDMLGYGDSSKPTDAKEYTTKKISGDLAALLDLLNVRRAVIIGHDWGSFISGRFALWHPERVLALVMISVPYTPPTREYIPLPEVVKRAPNLGYQLYFEDLHSSTQTLANLETFVGLIFREAGQPKLDVTTQGAMDKLLRDPMTPENLPTILNDQERAFYISELGKGMHGPLNYYRTSRYRYEEELAAGLPSQLRADLPYLFIWGTKDATATPFVIFKAHKFIPRYRDVAIEGKGHWLMVEAKDEITDLVSNWLEALTCSHPRTTKL